MSERGKAGIYLMTCKANGKRYVGQALSIGDRWLTHRSHMRVGRHGNRHMQRVWDKHGAESFAYEVLAYCEPTAEVLTAAEDFFITHIKPELNIMPAQSSPIGFKHPPRSAEFRKRMGDMKRGFKHSPETIDLLRRLSADQAYKPTAEHIEKLRAINTGKKKAPDAIEKWRASMVGHKQSADTIAKRGASNTGKKRTPDQCARISESLRGKRLGTKLSEETKAKIGAAHRGKPRPDVTISLSGRKRPQHVLDALSASNDARYAERRAKLIAAIQANPGMSIAGLARITGCEREMVAKYKKQYLNTDNSIKG